MDTLTFKDLTKMYNYDINNNYITGLLDFVADSIDKLNIVAKTYINNWVLIINLEKIKKDNKTEDLLNFYKWEKCSSFGRRSF